jgi:hypothetical protein
MAVVGFEYLTLGIEISLYFNCTVLFSSSYFHFRPESIVFKDTD